MSRKKREERFRAAEKAKAPASTAQQLDQMAAGLDVAPGPSRWWAKIVWYLAGKKWLLAILAVLLAGGIIFGVCTLMRHWLRTMPGRPVGPLAYFAVRRRAANQSTVSAMPSMTWCVGT